MMADNRFQRAFLCAACAALLVACDMLESHPYDTDISGETGLTEKNIALIEESMKDRTSFRFAMISDTQRWYDETVDVVDVLNERGDIDFVLHGGDQSDFGLTDEFEMMRDILNGLDMPWVAVIGNHDCLATGPAVYATMYGDTHFAFNAGNMRFVCIDTNSLEYDYADCAPDMDFILEQKTVMEEEGITKSAVLMHAPPGSDQFNNDLTDLFHEYTTSYPGLQMCMYGHNHSLEVDDMFDDGILYYQCPNIKQRIYLLFTINEEGYDYEAVSF